VNVDDFEIIHLYQMVPYSIIPWDLAIEDLETVVSIEDVIN